MKNLLIAITLIVGMNCYGQEKIEMSKNNVEFECDKVKFNPDKDIFVYIGNVSFKTDIIQFENAEKMVLNKKTNEIIVSGLNEFTIDGAIQTNVSSNLNVLRYKIGERIAYLE